MKRGPNFWAWVYGLGPWPVPALVRLDSTLESLWWSILYYEADLERHLVNYFGSATCPTFLETFWFFRKRSFADDFDQSWPRKWSVSGLLTSHLLQFHLPAAVAAPDRDGEKKAHFWCKLRSSYFAQHWLKKKGLAERRKDKWKVRK